MEGSVKLCFSLALLFLFADLALSQDSPALAPSPPPGEVLQPTASPPDVPASPPLPVETSPSEAPSSPPPIAPVPPPSEDSPPAPPPTEENPTSATPSPSPAPEPIGKDNEHIEASDGHPDEESESGGGLKGGQKAGIAIGVILGAGIVGLGGFVYKKRRDNIRRSQYGYAARRELL